MSFGTIGPAGSLVAEAQVTPAGQYASQPNGPVNGVAAEDIFWQKNEVETRSALNELRITSAPGQGDMLSARVNVLDPTIAAADTGGLTTQDPATAVNGVGADISGNVHGLPANFGPGRGRWRVGDIERVSVELYSYTDAAQGARGETPLIDMDCFFIDPDNDGWGDMLLIMHNHGAQAVIQRSHFTVCYNARS